MCRNTSGIQNRQTLQFFCNKFSLKWHIPLNDFYIIWHWERVPGLLPHVKFIRRRFRIEGLTPKSFKIGNFWYKFAIRAKSPEHFFSTKLVTGMRTPVSHTKFHTSGFGNVGVRTKWRCAGNFVSPQCNVSMRLTHYRERGILR